MQQSPSWAEHAARTLSAAGYRRGGARTAVLELLDRQRCALSAVEIEHALRGVGRRGVARASVYRILEELQHRGARASAAVPVGRQRVSGVLGPR